MMNRDYRVLVVLGKKSLDEEYLTLRNIQLHSGEYDVAYSEQEPESLSLDDYDLIFLDCRRDSGFGGPNVAQFYTPGRNNVCAIVSRSEEKEEIAEQLQSVGARIATFPITEDKVRRHLEEIAETAEVS